MTVDEMAHEFTKLTPNYCEYCNFEGYCEEVVCSKFLKQWLLSEVE